MQRFFGRNGEQCDGRQRRERRCQEYVDARGSATRCTRSPSTTSCTAHKACTAATSTRTPCRSGRCCRSRPAAAPRTAPTARRASATTPGVEREALMDARATCVARARAARRGRRDALLHGRRLARARRTATSTQVVGDGARASRALGLETCVTLGMLTPAQAQRAQGRRASTTTTTTSTPPQSILRRDHHHAHLRRPARHARRGARGRHRTSAAAASSAWARPPRDRAELLHTLATLDPHPESVPINELVQVPGTPLAARARSTRSSSCAPSRVARILMPRSHVRLSAGRTAMSDELQALCFLAGANSIFYGEKLLTTGNPDVAQRPRAVRPAGQSGRTADGRRT